MDIKSKIKELIPDQFQSWLYKSYYSFLPLRALFYKGNDVFCPVCQSEFRQFITVKPGKYRLENEQCPRCDSWKRHRVLWLYLENCTNLFSEKLKLLHIAPEYSLSINLKKMSNINYVSADLLSPLAMEKFDLTNIPYEDNIFDAILCNHILEHIPDDHKAMQELLRVLKPKGWAILQVPIDSSREQTFEDPNITSPQDRERFYWQYDHVRLYGLDYKDKLEAAGFKVKVDSYVKTLPTELITKYQLRRKEDVYYCTKE